MLPWDMLVTVNGYWHYKFRNTTLDDVVLPENEALRTLLTPPGMLWLFDALLVMWFALFPKRWILL